jgi:hypothetical protein
MSSTVTVTVTPARVLRHLRANLPVKAARLARPGSPPGRRPLIFKLNFRVTVMPVVRVTGGSQRPSLAGFESPADYHRSMPPSVGGMSIVMFEVTSRRSL